MPRPKSKDGKTRPQSFVEVPTRAMLFLRGLAANPSIRVALAGVGYSAADHAEGVRLLGEVLAVPAKDPSWRPRTEPPMSLAAFARTKLKPASILMRRRHPAEFARLFGIDVSVAESPDLYAAAFIANFGQLGSKSPARETLAGLGITAELCAALDPRTERWVDNGKGVDEKALSALREWTETWAALAHEAFSASRESLIRLGLSGRRTGAAASVADRGRV